MSAELGSEIMTNIPVLCFLLWESITDIKERCVSPVSIIIFFIMGLMCRLIFMGTGIGEVALSMSVGVLCILAATLTNQAIGCGDGLVLLVIGEFLGISAAVFILIVSLWIMMTVSIGILITGKIRRDTPLAFVPCIFAAYILWAVLIR